jgi:hypothetical protein
MNRRTREQLEAIPSIVAVLLFWAVIGTAIYLTVIATRNYLHNHPEGARSSPWPATVAP